MITLVHFWSSFSCSAITGSTSDGRCPDLNLEFPVTFVFGAASSTQFICIFPAAQHAELPTSLSIPERMSSATISSAFASKWQSTRPLHTLHNLVRRKSTFAFLFSISQTWYPPGPRAKHSECQFVYWYALVDGEPAVSRGFIVLNKYACIIIDAHSQTNGVLRFQPSDLPGKSIMTVVFHHLQWSYASS